MNIYYKSVHHSITREHNKIGIFLDDRIIHLHWGNIFLGDIRWSAVLWGMAP